MLEWNICITNPLSKLRYHHKRGIKTVLTHRHQGRMGHIFFFFSRHDKMAAERAKSQREWRTARKGLPVTIELKHV